MAWEYLQQQIASPEWDGQFWDAAKLAAAARAQNPGGDGRTVANDASWMGALNNLSGITVRDPARAGYTRYGDTNEEIAGTDAVYQDKFGRMYQTVKGAPGDPNTYIQFIDKNGAGFQNAEGSGRDRVAPIYKLNPDGTATPHSANTNYREGAWSRDGQELATWAAIMATAGLGGAALEAGAAGAGTGTGAGSSAAYGGGGVAGASGGSGSAIGADLGASIGAAEGGAGAVGAGTAAGTGGTGLTAAQTAYGGLEAGGAAAGMGGNATAAGTFGTAGASSAGAGAGGIMGSGVTGGQALQTGTGLLSAYLQSRSADKAQEALAGSTAAGMAENRRQYDQTRADFLPYRETGVRSLNELERANNTPVDPAEVMKDPGYAWGRDQGQQGLDRKIAASGGRVSGAALKAASEYNTNYATAGYDKAYARRNDRLNRLAALAGIGQTATGSTAQAGQNSSNALTSLLTSQGENQAAGSLAQGNIWGSAVNQLGAIGSKWASTPKQPQQDYYG